MEALIKIEDPVPEHWDCPRPWSFSRNSCSILYILLPNPSDHQEKKAALTYSGSVVLKFLFI